MSVNLPFNVEGSIRTNRKEKERKGKGKERKGKERKGKEKRREEEEEGRMMYDRDRDDQPTDSPRKAESIDTKLRNLDGELHLPSK